MNTQEKIIELKKIAAEIRDYKGIEIARMAKNPVPGEGDPDSPLLLIGEAPGQLEDETGRPFVGRSGKYMAQTLKESTGLDREQVYITNIVKYRPPDNRDPSPEEILACKDWLDRQIQIIKPKIIVTLGRFSMGKFIEGVTISRVHAQPKKCSLDFGSWNLEFVVFPMFHPAAALRSTQMAKDFKSDFNKLNILLKNLKQVNTAADNDTSGPHNPNPVLISKDKSHPQQPSLF